MEEPIEDVSTSIGDCFLYEFIALVFRLRSERFEGPLGNELWSARSEANSIDCECSTCDNTLDWRTSVAFVRTNGELRWAKRFNEPCCSNGSCG